MLNRERFKLLLDQYAAGQMPAEERSEFMAAVTSGLYDDLLLQHVEDNLQLQDADLEGANLPPHRAADMLHKIFSSEKQSTLLIPLKSAKPSVIRWSVAAAIVGIIACSAYFLLNQKNHDDQPGLSYAKEMTDKVNTSALPLKIMLEEGSTVTLQPGSTIHYPVHFLADKRELFLDGEAFFEVTKNASRPFFVYNKNIVTHVLGTSFNIRTNRKNHEMEVSVRSGRVEVYENKALVKNVSGKNNGVILLPNQKVTYDQDTRQFVPSLVDIPLPVIADSPVKDMSAENFVFENTPLKIVLASLEKTYGIDILVEEENIYKCLFTGDVGQQDLYTRLDIICQTVQASYEVKGTRILIKGKGCN